MKRAVMTALAVTLLSGTSALAQDGGSFGRFARQVAGAPQGARTPPPQRESRPQTQSAPSREERGGASSSAPRTRDNGGQSRGDRQPAATQRPQAAPPAVQQQGQRPQSGWQGQRRPDAQGQAQAQAQARAQAQNGRPGGWQGQRGPNGQAGQGQRGSDGRGSDRRPDGGYQGGRGGGDVGDFARNVIRQGQSENRRDWNNNDRGDYNRRPVIRPEDRRDRDRDRPRYDQRRYPHYVTPYQRYRWIGPSYRLPPGFYTFRWQWGQTLPWNWYTPNYYLNDYYAYGLPMPPIGCEWVRVGDDAILVDVFTGRIYQVVYNLFW